MINNFGIEDRVKYMGQNPTKHCSLKIDHKISFILSKDSETVKSLSLSLDINRKTQVSWMFDTKEIWIIDVSPDTEKGIVTIPWFDPDFSDYKKLINKIKTYVLFV